MSKNQPQRQVWVIDLFNMRIFDRELLCKSTKGQQLYCVSVDGTYDGSSRVFLQGLEKELLNEKKYGNEWVVSTNDTTIHVASSRETCIMFLKSKRQEYKHEIARCDTLLARYNQGPEYILNQFKKVLPVNVNVVVGEQHEDNVEIVHFDIDRTNDCVKLGQDICSFINERLGVQLEYLKDATITINISSCYIRFYIDKNTLVKVAEQYHKLPTITDRLVEIWKHNNYGFDVNFVRRDFAEIDYNFFKQRQQCVSVDFTYQDVDYAIRRQLASVIAISAMGRKKYKSQLNPIQFVLSPAAAKVITNIDERRNSLVMEYSSKNPIDDGRYYGLTVPITCYGHSRPDGTIALILESLPENTLVLSKVQYDKYTTRDVGILDAMMEEHL